MLILGFILGKLKKVTRWHCCWKILKRLIKVVITPLLSQLQGWPGWQKNGTMLRYLHLVVFCAKIEPKIEKIQKTIRKQGFFDDFLSILTVFWSLLNFGSILAQKLNRFICEKKNWIFWHPGHPWSCESSGEGKIRALSDTVSGCRLTGRFTTFCRYLMSKLKFFKNVSFLQGKFIFLLDHFFQNQNGNF